MQNGSISDDGAFALAVALKQNTTLTSLGLGVCCTLSDMERKWLTWEG